MKMGKHVGLAALIALCGVSVAQALEGVITMPNGAKRTVDIKWSARDKAYLIKEAGSTVELTLKPEDITDIQMPRPKELDSAIENIKQGSAAAAIPVLEKIANDYFMLQWDKTATRHLAEALVAADKADEAIRVCEKVVATTPEAAYLSEMAPIYWQALIKRDRVSKAEELIQKAIASGERVFSASALIARGDLIRATGGDTIDTARKALRDGYLRVVLLYKSERAVQPEALYKSAQCFEKIGASARADDMRTRLKGDFGASEWARK